MDHMYMDSASQRWTQPAWTQPALARGASSSTQTAHWDRLPENVEFRVAAFLNARSIHTFCSLSRHHRHLLNLNGMKFLCHELFGEEAVQAAGIDRMRKLKEVRLAFSKIKDHWLCGDDFNGAWLDDRRYFQRLEVPGSCRRGLYLKYVWWLDIQANFLAVRKGDYSLVVRLGKRKGSDNPNLGSLNYPNHRLTIYLSCPVNGAVFSEDIYTGLLQYQRVNRPPATTGSMRWRNWNFHQSASPAAAHRRIEERSPEERYQEGTTCVGQFRLDKDSPSVTLRFKELHSFKSDIMFHDFQLIPVIPVPT